MATVYVFSTAASTNDRLRLSVDDATGIFTVAGLNAADSIVVSHVLTVAQRQALCTLWKGSGDRTLQLKTDNPQLWVMFNGLDNSSVWSNGNAADGDSASIENVLDSGKTAAVIGWLTHGYVT